MNENTPTPKTLDKLAKLARKPGQTPEPVLPILPTRGIPAYQGHKLASPPAGIEVRGTTC
jgi:hypothetical protein